MHQSVNQIFVYWRRKTLFDTEAGEECNRNKEIQKVSMVI